MIRHLFLISTLIFMNKDETQKGPNIHGSSEPVFHLMTYLHIIYLLPLEKLELLSGYFSVMTFLHCPPPPKRDCSDVSSAITSKSGYL
jgi:hypothetical protein